MAIDTAQKRFAVIATITGLGLKLPDGGVNSVAERGEVAAIYAEPASAWDGVGGGTQTYRNPIRKPFHKVSLVQ